MKTRTTSLKKNLQKKKTPREKKEKNIKITKQLGNEARF